MNATTLKAYRMDDDTVYAAYSEEQARELFESECGPIPFGFGYELSDALLDEPQHETDENEAPTGEMSSIRQWLAECPEPGFLCGSE